jgi:two-component system response regulator NreC
MSPADVLAKERAAHAGEGASAPGGLQIDIVLAYRQAVVRKGLRMLLDGVDDFAVVAEAADVEGARECVKAHSPNVLVLDLDQPAGSPVASIGMLVEESPATSLVVMSSRREPSFVRAAMAAGAQGYVPSAATAEDLTLSIRRAASATSTPTTALEGAARRRYYASGPQDLSRRETEILGLIAMGHTNATIARRLELSVRTVETHRSHIRHKLGRLTRAELVDYAFEHGIGQSRT